jgi:hypothetical protein
MYPTAVQSVVEAHDTEVRPGTTLGRLWFAQVVPASVVTRMKPEPTPTSELGSVPTAKQSSADGHDTAEICDMSGGIDDSTLHGWGVVA